MTFSIAQCVWCVFVCIGGFFILVHRCKQQQHHGVSFDWHLKAIFIAKKQLKSVKSRNFFIGFFDALAIQVPN